VLLDPGVELDPGDVLLDLDAVLLGRLELAGVEGLREERGLAGGGDEQGSAAGGPAFGGGWWRRGDESREDGVVAAEIEDEPGVDPAVAHERLNLIPPHGGTS
jgi:hypothetical protein